MTDNRNHPGVAPGENMATYLHRRTHELGFPLPMRTCERVGIEIGQHMETLINQD